MNKTKLSKILADKAGAVLCIEPGETLKAAANKMAEHSMGALIVSANDQIQGIVTERDLLRHVGTSDTRPRDTPITEVMTRDLVYATPDNTVTEAMAIMSERHIRHLPVIEDGRLHGIISIGDLVAQAAQDHQAEIHTLNEYIAGSYPGVSVS